MKCKKCNNKSAVYHAISNDTCKICGDKVVTGYSPGKIICKKCSKEYDICEQCGKSLFQKCINCDNVTATFEDTICEICKDRYNFNSNNYNEIE